jgi:hypothetical protein
MALLWGRRSSWLLDARQKRQIRDAYAAGGTSLRKLAKRYGLRSHGSIVNIIRTERKRRQKGA